MRPGRIEPGERVGQIGRDLIGLDDDQVEVGTRVSARRPWPGPWSRMIVPVSAMATAQPVTTPLRRSSSAAGSGGSSRASVISAGNPASHPPGSSSGMTNRAGDRVGPGGQHAGDGGGKAGFRDALHDGAVIGDALGEQPGDAGVVVGPQVLPGQRRVRRIGIGPGPPPGPGRPRRWRRGCGPGSGPSRGAHDRVPLVRAHQARKDSGGGAGASRVSVQPRSGGGSRLIRPFLATTLRLAEAAR